MGPKLTGGNLVVGGGGGCYVWNVFTDKELSSFMILYVHWLKRPVKQK